MMTKHLSTKHLMLLLLVTIAIISCKNLKEEEPLVDNLLLKEWTGPYGGVPAFDQMKVEDVKAGMIQGMDLNLKNIEAIANNPEAPTFENTIEEMERSGKQLDRGSTYYGILSGNMSTPEFRDIQTELAPLFSEFRSKITQNEKLFKRVMTVIVYYHYIAKKPCIPARLY